MAQDFFYNQQLTKLTVALEFNRLGLDAWCDQFIDESVAQHGTELIFIFDDVTNICNRLLNACVQGGKMEAGMEAIALIAQRTAERLMNTYGFGRPDVVSVANS